MLRTDSQYAIDIALRSSGRGYNGYVCLFVSLSVCLSDFFSLLYLRNVWTYFTKPHHSYPLSGSRDEIATRLGAPGTHFH